MVCAPNGFEQVLPIRHGLCGSQPDRWQQKSGPYELV